MSELSSTDVSPSYNIWGAIFHEKWLNGGKWKVLTFRKIFSYYVWMARLPKETVEAGEYFELHFSDENNLGFVSWGNESLNASTNVCIYLIGLRYWLDVGASINKKNGESILNSAGQKVWDAENGKLEGTGLGGR